MSLTQEQLNLIEQKRLNALKIRRMKEMEQRNNGGNVGMIGNSNVCNFIHQPNKIQSQSSKNPWSLSSQSVAQASSSSPPPKQNYSNSLKQVDIKIVLHSRDRIALNFKYDPVVISELKQVRTALYNAQSKVWTVDISVFKEMVEKLNSLRKMNIKVKFPEVVPNCVLLALQQQRNQSVNEINLSEKLPHKFVNEMFEFQKEAVIFGISRNGRVLIADDMGLGKTVEALALACWYREDWPLLIICPSSLRYQWKKSILFWIDTVKEHHIAVLDKGNDKLDISHSRIVIVSYDLMTRQKKKLADLQFQIVIADESHYIKNDTATRTKTAVHLMKNARRLLLLSGTPALSRPIELFTQINVINNRIFPSKTEFGFRYCDGRTTKWGLDFRGSSNALELKIILESTVMIRRLKSEVLNQLPSKRRIKIVLPIEFVDNMEHQMKVFSTQLSGMANNKNSNSYKEVLLKWYNTSAEAKAFAVCEYVSHLVEQDKKFIFFAHHRIMLDKVAEMLESKDCSYIRIDGATSAKNRLEACEYFQENDSCKVAVISIVAASVGINLTAAHLVVFSELFWNPGILTQAEDRAHRIGQNDSVLIQYLLSPKTVDDFIWPMISRKFKVLNDVGLSKDSFKDAGMTDANQKLIEDFFTALPNPSDCDQL